MAFGDPVADIGGYGQGFGGPVGPEDERELSLYEQAMAKFGSPFERGIGYITNQGIANLNPAMGLINVLGTAKNLLDTGIEKSPLTGSPDLSLTNPNKSLDDAGVFSGQTLSPSYSGGNIGGFDLGGGPYTSLGTTVGSLTEDAIEGAFPNVQFGIDPNNTYGTTIDDSMEQNPIMDFANLGPFDSIQEQTEFEQELFDPINMTAQLEYGIPKPTPLLGLLTDEEAMDIILEPRPNAVPPDISYSPSLDSYMTNNGLVSMGMEAIRSFRNMFGPTYGSTEGGGGGFAPDLDAVSEAGGEALQEAVAQRVAETIIEQQAARQPSNNVTIPTSSGPDIVIDVTPPKPQASVAPQRRTAPRPSPVKIAAKSIAKPKAFKKLPKFAQKEIRQGRVPTSGSDNVQDMVRAFLGGQESFGDSGTRK